MNTRTWIVFTFGSFFTTLLFFIPAELQCDDAPSDALWSRDYLTGDWAGGRNELSIRGIDFGFGYTSEVMSNRSGGLDIGTAYNGLGELGLDLDLEKLTSWWKGGSFRINSIWLHGKSPSEHYVGDVMALSNIDGHDSIRLYEVWWMQQFLEQRLTLQVGNMLVDEDFTVNDMGGLFLNSAFGWPQFITANSGTVVPAISDHEIAVEMTYYADITPWWSIQPDIQYIIHPGGSSELPNAFMIGLRSSLTF